MFKIIKNKIAITILLFTIFACNGNNNSDTEYIKYVAGKGEVKKTETEKNQENDWEKIIDIKTEKVKLGNIKKTVIVPGKIIPVPNKKAIISPFIESGINKVEVNLGDAINKGDLLVCLTSPTIGNLRAEYDKAKAELKLQNENYIRKKKLYSEKIISKSMFQETELLFEKAKINFEYTRKKLIAIGLSEREIEKEPSQHNSASGSIVHIYAPLSGEITYMDASLGQKVSTSSKLLEIINLDEVWLEADIFTKDLQEIKKGAEVIIDTYGNKKLSGKIFNIGNILNEKTKTVKVFSSIKNREHLLKLGMLISAKIVTSSKENIFVIPKEAVITEENEHHVFVKEGKEYHLHDVVIGISDEKYVEIISGIEAGEEVVVRGNFQLQSKMKMENIDPHAGHNH